MYGMAIKYIMRAYSYVDKSEACMHARVSKIKPGPVQPQAIASYRYNYSYISSIINFLAG